MRAQQPGAEAVEGSHEGRLGVACRLAPAQFEQPRPDARAQLAGGPLGERDREDPPRGDAVLQDRSHEALDQHRGLAAAGGRGKRQRLGAPCSRGLLLLGQRVPMAALIARTGRSMGSCSRPSRRSSRGAPRARLHPPELRSRGRSWPPARAAPRASSCSSTSVLTLLDLQFARLRRSAPAPAGLPTAAGRGPPTAGRSSSCSTASM